MRFHKLWLGSFLILMLSLMVTISPRAAHLPRLVDDADLLTASEEDDLLEKLDQVSESRQCDVVIVTNHSLDGKTAEDYADDYFDENGYGMGSDRDGILFLVSMDDRDWYMSTSGFGIEAFTDAGREYMEKKIIPDLSSGDYYEAFETYTNLCDDYLDQARKGKPYDRDNLPKNKMNPLLFLGDFILSFLASFFMAGRKKKELKSVRHKTRAGVYMVKGSLDLTEHTDHFVTSRTVSRIIERDHDEDKGSGGSDTHISSSGHTHGGSGGKF